MTAGDSSAREASEALNAAVSQPEVTTKAVENTKQELPQQEELTTETSEETPSEATSDAEENKAQPVGNGQLIVIDAGHQAQGDSSQEPVGPGSSETKARVAGGATGISTGTPEYELNLAVALKLRDELTARGYTVSMIRETNDVNISNAERAQTANSLGAAAFLRIHANGSSNTSVNGALTMCMSPSNPYNSNLYDQSRRLSQCVVQGLCNSTGAANQGVQETDTMSGINWCTVPVTIIEMGFMSNSSEDQLMNTDSYRTQLSIGIADGVDAYFGR